MVCSSVFYIGVKYQSSQGYGWLNELGSSITSLIQAYHQYAWIRPRLCILQKGCTRLAAASDKVYQLLANGLWFFPGTPASFTTKTGRHDIAEILLKVALKHTKKNQPIVTYYWTGIVVVKDTEQKVHDNLNIQ